MDSISDSNSSETDFYDSEGFTSTSTLVANLTKEEAEIIEFIRVLRACPCLWHKPTRLQTPSKERLNAYLILLHKWKAFYHKSTFQSVRKIVHRLIQLVRVEEACGIDLEEQDLQSIYKLLDEPGNIKDINDEEPDAIMRIVINSNTLLNELDFLLCTADDQIREIKKCPFCYWMAPNQNKLWTHMVETYIEKPKNIEKIEQELEIPCEPCYHLHKTTSRMDIRSSGQKSPTVSNPLITTSAHSRDLKSVKEKYASERAFKTSTSMVDKDKHLLDNTLSEKIVIHKSKSSPTKVSTKSLNAPLQNQLTSCNNHFLKPNTSEQNTLLVKDSVKQCEIKSEISIKYNLRSQSALKMPEADIHKGKKELSKSVVATKLADDEKGGSSSVQNKPTKSSLPKSSTSNVKPKVEQKRRRLRKPRVRKAAKTTKKQQKKKLINSTTQKQKAIKEPRVSRKISKHVNTNATSESSVLDGKLNSRLSMSCKSEVGSGSSKEIFSSSNDIQKLNGIIKQGRGYTKIAIRKSKETFDKTKKVKSLGGVRRSRKVYKTPSSLLSTYSTESDIRAKQSSKCKCVESARSAKVNPMRTDRVNIIIKDSIKIPKNKVSRKLKNSEELNTAMNYVSVSNVGQKTVRPSKNIKKKQPPRACTVAKNNTKKSFETSSDISIGKPGKRKCVLPSDAICKETIPTQEKRIKICKSTKPDEDKRQNYTSVIKFDALKSSTLAENQHKPSTTSVKRQKIKAERTKIPVSKEKPKKNQVLETNESETNDTITSLDFTKAVSLEEVLNDHSSSSSNDVIFIPTKTVVIEIDDSPSITRYPKSNTLSSEKVGKQLKFSPKKERQHSIETKCKDKDLSRLSDSFLNEFIQLYRKHECLWKRDSELYRARNLKISAYGSLLNVYRKGTRDAAATLQKVKSLIRRLRVCNRRLNKPSPGLERPYIYTSLNFLNAARPLNIPNSCTHCGLIFDSTLGLRRHSQDIHEEMQPFKCGKCSMRFKYKSQIGRHFQSVHLPSNQ